jgi:hypothetical protein
MQFTSLTFCLDMLDFRVRNPTGKAIIERPATDKEFHAGLLFLTQVLYVIRDMASSTNIEGKVEGEAPVENKNKKNASILKSFLF